MSYTLKKSLGQHFLKDEQICLRIVEVLHREPLDNLVEVGPGGGALTKYLLQIPNIHFKAIEVDDEKVQYLRKIFPAIEGKLIHQDFLKMSLPFDESFSVVGNFPYNISSQILFKILEWKTYVPRVIGMFQREVAQRVVATHGNKSYGILSVLVQAFYDVEYLFDVSPNCFNPPPKVMSGVIALKRKTTVPDMRSEKHFFNLVKIAFNQRRKMLRNTLKPLLSEQELQDPIFTKRAEQLSVEALAALTFRLQ